MNPVRSRFAASLLLAGALLLALSEVMHPVFHRRACGETILIVTETVLDTASADAAFIPGVKFCPVCSGIFSAVEPPAGQSIPSVAYPGFQMPPDAAEPDTVPYFRLRARAPPFC